MTEYIAWCQAFRVTNTRIKKPSSCNILLLLMRHTMHTFNAYEYVLPDRGNMKIMSMQKKNLLCLRSLLSRHPDSHKESGLLKV